LAKFDDLVELFWPNLMIWRSGFGEIEDLAKVFLAKFDDLAK